MTGIKSWELFRISCALKVDQLVVLDRVDDYF